MVNTIQKQHAKADKRAKKDLRRDWRKEYPGAFVSYVGPMTVIFVPSCRGNGHISWSICNGADKFRKWEGWYKAYTRDPLPIIGFPVNQNDADNFASCIMDTMGI